MKIKLGAVALAVSSVVAMANAQAAEDAQRYIVKFKSGATFAMSATINQQGDAVKRVIGQRNMLSMEMDDAAAQRMAMRPDVAFVELDPKRYLQAESTPYGITMVQADQLSDEFTGDFTVCITDTGYSLGHEDLPTTGVTGDDGYGDNDTGNWYEDGHGHGTHVAGTIAGLGGNDLGVVGVNPSDKLKLHIVKVFDNNGSWAYGSDLIAAVDQCTTAGAKVISMSLGGGYSSQAEQEAFDTALANGVLSIAAAGNGGNSSYSYPASYDSVMSVAAVDENGNKAGFSQYNDQVEIAAPGVAVNSTLPGNSYAAWNGTSMATPHVAGVAALVWSHYPECSASEIRQAMNKSAEDRGSLLWDKNYGHGIVKAKDMYDMLADGCDVGPIDPPPPPPEPTELTKGVPETNLAGATGDELHFKLNVPAGASDLVFTMSGGSGDADLYVRFGDKATGSDWDCRPYKWGNEEVCSFPSPQEGTYYVMLQAYSSFDDVTLIGDYVEGEVPPSDIEFAAEAQVRSTYTLVRMNWSGANGDMMDIYRDGVKYATTANDGVTIDRLKALSGSHTYKICEAGTNVCSANVSVNF